MADDTFRLTNDELIKMSKQVGADDGPGSAGWNGAGSTTQRVNDAVMAELRANGGKLSGELAAMPCLILTTTGAKSGARRTIPLAYAVVDDRLLLIASMGGSVRNPPWYHNLVAHPDVEVELDGETFGARAAVTEGADRDHLFEQICAGMPIFAKYQQNTDRTIPVVELTRV